MVFNQSNCSDIRDILCNAVIKVFGSEDTFFTFILDENYSSNYDCYVDGSGENYIINNVTGEYINWYKLYHLGRCASFSIFRFSIFRFNYEYIEKWLEIFLTEFKEGGQHENNKTT